MKELRQETINARPLDAGAGQVTNAAETVLDIVQEAVGHPSAGDVARRERLALLAKLRITTQTVVEPLRYSLTVDGVGVFALSDIHAIKGKQKSGKSAVLKCVLAALLGGGVFRLKSELEAPVVLHLDTEQQNADVKLVVDVAREMSGATDEYIDQHLFLYTLRTLSYDTLLSDTRMLIALHRPQVVLIDGVVDYVASFNDEVMSRDVIHQLVQICQEHQCAIINVLHENKSQEDSNMRGHLGTVQSQKSGSVVQCVKKDGIVTVSSSDARHTPMPTWSIAFDAEGRIVDADARHEAQMQLMAEQKRRKKLEEHEQALRGRLALAQGLVSEHGGSISKRDLKRLMAEKLKLDPSTISKFIKNQLEAETLFENERMILLQPVPQLPF